MTQESITGIKLQAYFFALIHDRSWAFWSEGSAYYTYTARESKDINSQVFKGESCNKAKLDKNCFIRIQRRILQQRQSRQ